MPSPFLVVEEFLSEHRWFSAGCRWKWLLSLGRLEDRDGLGDQRRLLQRERSSRLGEPRRLHEDVECPVLLLYQFIVHVSHLFVCKRDVKINTDNVS